MFYFQSMFMNALNGIDSQNITSGIVQIANTILIVSFLYAAYQSFSSGGDVRALQLWHWSVPRDILGRVAKLLPYIGLVAGVDAVTYFTGDSFFFARRAPWVTALFYLFLLYTIIILGMTGGEQFIYFAF